MMRIDVLATQGKVPVTILRPHGELDASNYQVLIAEAQKAYETGARDILLDMAEVPFMSSSGLVALQSMAALLRGEEPPDPESGWAAFRSIHRDRDVGSQVHFKILNPQPRVDRVLETVGFKRFLEVFSDMETAVASYG
jgi:anti-anti-sigma regulatory factor